MHLHSDLREFIGLLNAHRVEYVIVGAHALAFHGHPRSTGDLDIFIRPSPDNTRRLEEVLRQFGFASLGLSAEDFLIGDQVVQLGVPPNRIDLLTSVGGVSFEEAWKSRVPAEIDGLSAAFIGRQEFIKSKMAAGRTQDRADLEALGVEF